jgi:hypothetical protein
VTWASIGTLARSAAVARQRLPRSLENGIDVAGGNFIGEADALHGQVQPLGRYEIEARQPGEPGLRAHGKIAYRWQLGEGDVPGVHAAAHPPSRAPPPMIRDLHSSDPISRLGDQAER